MDVGAGLYMYVVVVQKFTFAISSADEFLLLYQFDWIIAPCIVYSFSHFPVFVQEILPDGDISVQFINLCCLCFGQLGGRLLETCCFVEAQIRLLISLTKRSHAVYLQNALPLCHRHLFPRKKTAR